MKQIALVCLIIIFTSLLTFSFRTKFQTGVVGRIDPMSGANLVWIVGGHDSLVCAVVNGEFGFDTRPGIYKVVIHGVAPFKDEVLENVGVRDGQTLDVGEIVLQR